MGRVIHKYAFNYVQNVRIHIILRTRKVLSEHCALHWYIL